MPPPYTRPEVGTDPVAAAGVGVVRVVVPCVCEDKVEVASFGAAPLEPRTNRCLSSPSSSLESLSSSNASARSGFTSLLRSLDEALERNDGGGELGIGCVGLGKGSVGESLKSSSSRAFTCRRMLATAPNKP